ncbi:MAG: ABC transporter ATP-binding protein, partial [Treponemataceae bacterium]|nr:ABC transporter ATP-binding protein [Treponemataceae bacterium]
SRFPGGVLFSSHDHEFVSSVANRIIEITPSGVFDRMMPFDDYLADEQIRQLRKEAYAGTDKKIRI